MIRRIARIIRDSSVYELAVSSEFYRALHNLSDSFALRLSNIGFDSTTVERHLLMAPTGGGNIGDQALFESFLATTGGSVNVVVGSNDALIVPDSEQSRVSVHVVPGFTYLPPIFRIGAALRVARLIRASRSVSVIGADLMDGLYNPAASIARASMLWMAAVAEVPSGLIGCSWAADAHQTCVRALQRADTAGAEINFRDAISQGRALNDGIIGARLTSDIVFALGEANEGSPADEFMRMQTALGRQLAVVNVSGLISRRFDQTRDYLEIIGDLIDRGFSVVILPHVFRPTGDDLAASRRLMSEVESEFVFLVTDQLRPRQIRTLVRNASRVITGRMHLAVMALSEFVVPITLGTHGKVEGLYQHFGLSGLCIEPVQGFAREVMAVLNSVEEIEIEPAKLLLVQDLAHSNVRHVTAARPSLVR